MVRPYAAIAEIKSNKLTGKLGGEGPASTARETKILSRGFKNRKHRMTEDAIRRQKADLQNLAKPKIIYGSYMIDILRQVMQLGTFWNGLGFRQ